MTEETWRPLGVDTEDEVASYDALHDGVPDWMTTAFWSWIRSELAIRARDEIYPANVCLMVNQTLAEQMCQRLRIPVGDLTPQMITESSGAVQFNTLMKALKASPSPLQIADYLLAHGTNPALQVLEGVLERSKSAWTVGERTGRPGLVRRVPEGVQDAANSVMARAGRAGVRLAQAWEALYGLDPNPGAAYGLAIKAIEDAAIPVVSPTNEKATLGTVLAQMEQQANWKLPMDREDDRAASGATIVSMMRLVWVGQHDRHGGQPSAPGDVSIEEATVAVSLAVTLVNLFAAALPARVS
ncbi:MAG: hypothetical protein OSB43_06605 [Nocardioides sp.]|uniref:hypothetical protein n=1 Tax=Nocardioides sp. TaxID=35761 RepID=UPI00238CE19A|nr:hypothetical protein [Nocardioides sp.]MDE0775923.1 hypothetical protein [Nocardioides sp.]